MLALIVDDEESTARLLQPALRDAGFETAAAGHGRAGLHLAAERTPQVILLGWTLPDLPGPLACRRVKADPAARAARVIYLATCAGEEERLTAFAAGADDFVAKPFSVRELVLRCQAMTRSSAAGSAGESSVFRMGPFTLDPGQCRLRVDGRLVRLPPVGIKLLSSLMRAQGRVRTREELLKSIWQKQPDGSRALDVNVARLRNRLHPHQAWLQTVRAVGYRLGSPSSGA